MEEKKIKVYLKKKNEYRQIEIKILENKIMKVRKFRQIKF